MPYFILFLGISVGLLVFFTFAAEATFVSKVIVVILYALGFACYFLFFFFIGLFLLVALNLYILYYMICLQSRFGE